MTSRLVLFIAFLSILSGLLYLRGYTSHFNDTRDLSHSAFVKASQPVVAASTETVATNKSVKLILDTEDLKKAHEIYTKTGQCITCHGEKGQGMKEQLAPAIAGQHDWYVYEQLILMKKGERLNEKMMPYLKNLTEADFKVLSEYIAKLRNNENFTIE
jgi:cytochrome c553